MREGRESDALDTEGEALVQVIFTLPRVQESDVVEGENLRRKLGDVLEVVLEVEAKGLAEFDLLDEAGGLHLVDDLLLGLGLLDEIGVRTSRGDEPGKTIRAVARQATSK